MSALITLLHDLTIAGVLTLSPTTGTTLVVSSTTDSSSVSTGCVTLQGGMGIVGSVFTSGVINSTQTSTLTSGTISGIVGNLTGNPGSASTGQYVPGRYIVATAGSQNLTAVGLGGICGISGQPSHNGSGTLTRGTGVNVTMTMGASGGPVTDYQGFRAILNNTSGSICTSAYGFRVETFTNTGAGSITTIYGLKVENQTVGGTNYAIFTGSGIVHIGDTTASTTTANGCATFAGGVGVAGTLNAANLHGSLATTDLTGTLQAAQMPALTGDVSNTAGNLTTSLTSQSIAKIRANMTLRAA